VKKFLRVAVPLALVGALAGCSATPAADPSPAVTFSAAHPVTIEFWNTYTGPLEDELSSIVKDFESSHPGINVKLVYQPYDTILQSLQTAVAAGQPPALSQLELTQMAQLASFGALDPLSKELTATQEKSVEAAMIPSIATANSYDGTLYTVPMGYNSNVLYYNPDLIKKAGLTPADLPKTWAQLEKDGALLTQDTNGDGTPDVYGYGFPAQAPWILEPRLWQVGGEVFNKDNTQATFNSAAGQKVLANYQALVKDKAGEMVQNDSSLSQLTSLFATGKIAMFEQSSTAMQGIDAAAPFTVGVSQFPTMGKPVYSLGGYNLGIFKDAPADQKAAAAEFEQWWATPKVAAEWTSISNYMPGIKAALTSATYKKWLAQDPRRGVAAKQLSGARSRPNLPSYPQISTDWANAFQATLSGQGTAKSNLDSAAKTSDGILATSGN
jgi:ABC-type glycerol-3-phosphate transport system substrate-binding protein